MRRTDIAPNAPTVMVLRHHGLGDLVTVQPALRALRRRFPAHRILTTCPSWLVSLARLFGSVDGVLSERSGSHNGGPTDHQGVDPAILESVAALEAPIDHLISLRTPGPELARLKEVLRPVHFLSYRFDGLPETMSAPELDFRDHILVRWARLLASIGCTPRVDDLFLSSPISAWDPGTVVLHPGAGSPARHWPEERWAAVARDVARQGFEVRITGSAAEVARCRAIRALAGLDEGTNLAGRTSIDRLVALVAHARCVVSVDTGVSHLATALRRPAVTLFGPVDPACWGPPPGLPEHRTLWAGLEGDTYANSPHEGLLQIPTSEVIRQVRAALGAAQCSNSSMDGAQGAEVG